MFKIISSDYSTVWPKKDLSLNLLLAFVFVLICARHVLSTWLGKQHWNHDPWLSLARRKQRTALLACFIYSCSSFGRMNVFVSSSALANRFAAIHSRFSDLEAVLLINWRYSPSTVKNYSLSDPSENAGHRFNAPTLSSAAWKTSHCRSFRPFGCAANATMTSFLVFVFQPVNPSDRVDFNVKQKTIVLRHCFSLSLSLRAE